MTDNPSPVLPRIFKIGANRIVEDPSATASLSNEQIRNLLKVNYPEVAHATIRERIEATDAGEVQVVEFMPQAGHKG